MIDLISGFHRRHSPPNGFDFLPNSRFHWPWQDQGLNLHYRLVFGHQGAFIYVKASSNANDRIKKCLFRLRGRECDFYGLFYFCLLVDPHADSDDDLYRG